MRRQVPYLRYLEVYPEGRFVDLARKEVRALRQAAEDIRRSEERRRQETDPAKKRSLVVLRTQAHWPLSLM